MKCELINKILYVMQVVNQLIIMVNDAGLESINNNIGLIPIVIILTHESINKYVWQHMNQLIIIVNDAPVESIN